MGYGEEFFLMMKDNSENFPQIFNSATVIREDEEEPTEPRAFKINDDLYLIGQRSFFRSGAITKNFSEKFQDKGQSRRIFQKSQKLGVRRHKILQKFHNRMSPP